MSGGNEIAEWKVEYPVSKRPENTQTMAYTFYDEGEAREFAAPLATVLPGRVTVYRRTITVSEWQEEQQ